MRPARACTPIPSIRKSPGPGTGMPVSSIRITTKPATTPCCSRKLESASRTASHHCMGELLVLLAVRVPGHGGAQGHLASAGGARRRSDADRHGLHCLADFEQGAAPARVAVDRDLSSTRPGGLWNPAIGESAYGDHVAAIVWHHPNTADAATCHERQIGRASCRER